MTAPVGVVMRRAAELAASRLRPLETAAEESTARSMSLAAASSGCTYCGSRTNRRIACHAHSDLPAIDPFFSPDVPQNTEPAEDFRPEVLLDRLLPIGA